MFSLFTDLCSGSVQVHLRLPMKYLWNSVCVCLNNRCSFKKTSRKIFKPFPHTKKSFSIFFIETKIQTSFTMKHTISLYGVLLMFFCFILNKVHAILKKLKSQNNWFSFWKHTWVHLPYLLMVLKAFFHQWHIQRNYFTKPCILKPFILCMWYFLAHWATDHGLLWAVIKFILCLVQVGRSC